MISAYLIPHQTAAYADHFTNTQWIFIVEANIESLGQDLKLLRWSELVSNKDDTHLSIIVRKNMHSATCNANSQCSRCLAAPSWQRYDVSSHPIFYKAELPV